MAKTVNATFSVVRDGKQVEVRGYDKLGYATFVALQTAVVAVLASLSAWAVQRVAAGTDRWTLPFSGGDESVDLRIELRADHGDGSSDFSLGFSGVGDPEADRIVAAFVDAVINRKPMPVGAEDGRMAIVLAEAALKSLKTGRPVKVN